MSPEVDAQPISIALIDRSAGYEATPAKVRLHALTEFLRDVERFLRGDSKEIDPDQLDVSVRTGSLEIATAPISVSAGIFGDLQHLGESESLDRVDCTRRLVMARWQKRARFDSNIAFRISSPVLKTPILVSSESDYHDDDADKWVTVERYIRGEIQDLGGATRANAHIRLPDGKTLTVAAERQTLREETENRLYKTAMLRVRAKYNLDTGELADAVLIEFVQYAPDEEDDLTELRRRGALAWKDVEDASRWVDEIRGGNPA